MDCYRAGISLVLAFLNLCFPAELPTSVFGDKLREQVEERLSFYETGTVPRKNVDVMQEAVKEVRNTAPAGCVRYYRCK